MNRSVNRSGALRAMGANLLAIAPAPILLAMIPLAMILLSGCQSPDPEGGVYLRFQNPELAAGLDSLQVLGVNAAKGDTVPILRWFKGEAFPAEALYPPGLESAFTMLVRGYQGESLVYQSRTAVSGGHAQAPVRDFRLAAPALTDVPVALTARVRDAVSLEPVWETRPGIYREDSGGTASFTPEADFTWSRDGRVLGRDSVLGFGGIALTDAGTYVFTAGNRAGRDSLAFTLTVKQMLPRIADLPTQSAPAGKPLTVKPGINRSDSLRYRWSKEGSLLSTDSVLVFPALAAEDTGSYQLAVANASDTTETAVSNRFAVRLALDPNAAWKPEKTVTAGAQSNSSHGTALDLDVAKAMLSSEAAQKQPLIDLLFVYSGGALKLMSPVAAKQAADLDYADAYDDAKIADVRFVSAAAKPATPAAGRETYDAGTKVNSATAAAGQGFLVKTTDGNLAWIRIESIQGGSAASASADLTVALGAY